LDPAAGHPGNAVEVLSDVGGNITLSASLRKAYGIGSMSVRLSVRLSVRVTEQASNKGPVASSSVNFSYQLTRCRCRDNGGSRDTSANRSVGIWVS